MHQMIVPAMSNLQTASQKLGLDKFTKPSTPSTPPSAGRFAHSVLPFVEQMLKLLNRTGAPFLADVCPVEAVLYRSWIGR